MAICAMVAFSFTSCKEETTKELLMHSKGWTLTAATCDPAYQLEIGAPITNLFDGFISSCEKDDIIYFNENGSQVLDYGKDKDTYPCGVEKAEKEKSLGNWTLVDDKTLKFYFPAYPQVLTATILTAEDKTLKLSVPIAEDDLISKEFRGVKDGKTVRNYVFTLTYTKN